MQPHIHLNEGLGIRCAILPGDPARVERIAAYLDDVCDHGSHREYRSISGTWRGVPVLAMSTGMGGPSTAIAVEELRRIGVESLLRIGSCGALQSGIAVGELLLVQAAVRDEGTSRAYVPEGYPAVSDAALLALCARSARRRGMKAHIGLVRSHDSFYIDGQEDVNRRRRAPARWACCRWRWRRPSGPWATRRQPVRPCCCAAAGLRRRRRTSRRRHGWWSWPPTRYFRSDL